MSRPNKAKTLALIRDCAKAVTPGPSGQRPTPFRDAVLARLERDGITAKDVALLDRLTEMHNPSPSGRHRA